MISLPAPVRGALWLMLGGMMFTVMSAMLRLVTDELPPLEVVAIRNTFSLLFMAPWLWRAGRRALITRRPVLMCLRSLIVLAAMVSWVIAIAGMPLAGAVALSFTQPLFTTVLVALFLRERVGPRRVAAIMVGFCGMLLILRPGIVEVSPAALFAVACASSMAVGNVLMKVLTRTESTTTVVLYMYLLTAPLSLIPAAFIWVTPSIEALGWLAIMGLVASLGHLSAVRAYGIAEVTAILPGDFFRLIAAAVIGFVFFAEPPDLWTWLGAAIIFAAVIYTAHREARLAREDRPADS